MDDYHPPRAVLINSSVHMYHGCVWNPVKCVVTGKRVAHKQVR
jgi:hypothetical protein